jgi:cytochrome c556
MNCWSFEERQTMKRHCLIALLLPLTVISCTADKATPAPPPPPKPSIMVLMTDTITPASDIIWGVEDPQTDEEWQVLDDAAVTLMESFEQTRNGGIGPNDDAWASEAKFQAYIDQEMAALEQARAAIAARNLDGLFDAGGELYTPCEECHIDYNPAVEEQPY